MIYGINHITLAVSNVKRSFMFYKDILGLKPLCIWHAGAYLLAGETWFCLSYDSNISSVNNNDYTHYAFSIHQENFLGMKQQIINSGCKIFKENHSEGDSLYFCDPDGHKLELHVGDWKSRIVSKRLDQGNWQDVEFFVD